MILPFVTAISRDVFETVPSVLKEAAYGVGATTFEVVGNIVLPYTRVGVVGGVMLALGRALGETMAVTFVIGNATKISTSILSQGTTISAMIANQFAGRRSGLVHFPAARARVHPLFRLPARWMLVAPQGEGGDADGESLSRAQAPQRDLDRARLGRDGFSAWVGSS